MPIINACCERYLLGRLPNALLQAFASYEPRTTIYGSSAAGQRCCNCTMCSLHGAHYLCSLRKALFGNLYLPLQQYLFPVSNIRSHTLFARCNQNISVGILNMFSGQVGWSLYIELYCSKCIFVIDLKRFLLMQIFLLIPTKCRLSPPHPSSGALTVATLGPLEKYR